MARIRDQYRTRIRAQSVTRIRVLAGYYQSQAQYEYRVRAQCVIMVRAQSEARSGTSPHWP